MTNTVEVKPQADLWATARKLAAWAARAATNGPLSGHRRRAIGYLGATLLPLALGGCSVFSGNDAPAAKEPVRLELAIQAAPDANVDLHGRGAPMLLRIYELKSEVAFQDADFFALQNTHKPVLGADLLAVDQFIVRPGETREIKRKSNPETTALGIFAGYRDMPNAVWRVIYKIPTAPDANWYRAVIPNDKVVLKIDLQSSAIVLTGKGAAPRPVERENEPLSKLDGPVDSISSKATASETPEPGALDRFKKFFSSP